MEEQFKVGTPESVSFNYTLAGIGSRYQAALLDHLLMGLIIILLAIGGRLAQGYDTFSLFSAFIYIASFAVLFGYYTFFETVWRGQSPGKRAMNLRVLKANGLPITFTDALLRNIVRLIDFLPASYGLGLTVMFFNRRWQRLGDLAAGTVVVRENPALRLEQIAVSQYLPVAPLPRAQAAAAAPLVYHPSSRPIPAGMLPSGNPAIPHIERLSNSDYQLVRDYLLRRPALAWPRQDQLDRMLTEMVVRKLQTPMRVQSAIHFLYQAAESYEMAQLR